MNLISELDKDSLVIWLMNSDGLYCRKYFSVWIVLIYFTPHIQVMGSVLQLGFITLFLSDALVNSYTCAASFVILTLQIRFILSLDPTDSKVDPGLFVRPRVSCVVVHCGVNMKGMLQQYRK